MLNNERLVIKGMIDVKSWSAWKVQCVNILLKNFVKKCAVL